MPNASANPELRATPRGPSGRPRAQDIDRHVGVRIRERRTILGLTQQQLAELVGITYQQAHKYEKGINRVAAGRLHGIAEALDVGVSYFFEGLDADDADAPGAAEPTPRQRAMLELAQTFVALPSRRHQEVLCQLARGLAELEAEPSGIEPAVDEGGAVVHSAAILSASPTA